MHRTYIESAKKIVRQGHCAGVACHNCPANMVIPCTRQFRGGMSREIDDMLEALIEDGGD